MYCANPAQYRASIRGLCRHLGENLFTRRSLDLRRGLKSIVLCFGTLIIILCCAIAKLWKTKFHGDFCCVPGQALHHPASKLQATRLFGLWRNRGTFRNCTIKRIDQSWKRAFVTEPRFSVLADVAIKMNNIFQWKLKAVDEVDSEQF